MTAEVAGYIGMVAAICAAAFWLIGSFIKVPDDINTFIDVLQRIGRWNSYAAIAAMIAAICAAIIFFQQISPTGGT